MAIIDASVYITLMNAHESHHTAAWDWFQLVQAAGESLAAPVILLPEMAAGLSRGLGNAPLAHQVVRQLVQAQLIDMIPVTPALAERAAAIAADHQLRGCDAIYVALAEQLGDELVTLDQQQLERGAALVTTRKP
ncbi:MAG: PIN domain-containing protein [Chloroflexota bacterium]